MVQGQLREFLEEQGFEHLPYDGEDEHWWRPGQHCYVNGPKWTVHAQKSRIETSTGRGLNDLERVIGRNGK